jgi:hypothetical protein
MKQIHAKLKARHEENPHRKDEERVKAKIFGMNSQLDGLAERLSELPKSVSAAPIYKQMERLENLKSELEVELKTLKESGRSSLDRLVNPNNFEEFASHYRDFLRTANPTQEKLILQKFIRKIEVGVDQVRIHWIVDKDHYERELALKRAGSRPINGPALGDNFFNNFGSNTLTIGAQVEQVDEHLTHDSTALIFDYECFPEAKILLGSELKALFLKLGSWTAVGSSIGASESFARQNVNKE